MNNFARFAIAAAAVVVIAIVGINLLPRSGGVGGVTPAPVATATPTPTPSPTPSPSPTPLPTLPPGDGAAIGAGTYQSEWVTVTVPAGWVHGVTVVKPDAGPPNGMALDWLRSIDTVYNDPCHWKTTATSVGPTVNELVTAFVAQKRGSNITPVDVTIDGFRGKEIDLVVPLDVKIANCDDGLYKPWPDRSNQAPGQHELLDIVDVNGQTRVISRRFYAANTAVDMAELQAIVDSIKITP